MTACNVTDVNDMTNINTNINPELLRLLFEQYGALANEIVCGYSVHRPITLRINRLKAERDEVIEALELSGAKIETVGWYDDAVIVRNISQGDIESMDIYKDGKIYLQSLSSMVPPILLLARPGESVLDMAAAPGGKTTQIAALTGGKADITACEKNKIRAKRMKFNLERQGAGRVTVMVCDSRRLDPNFCFDKILLDAPCSGSGTVLHGSCDFTLELYERSRRTQKQLLDKALSLLHPGKRLVYSTCSVLFGENEDVIETALEKKARIIEISNDAFSEIPRLPVKIKGTLCIKPTELYEGFFAAVLEKI